MKSNFSDRLLFARHIPNQHDYIINFLVAVKIVKEEFSAVENALWEILSYLKNIRCIGMAENEIVNVLIIERELEEHFMERLRTYIK